MGLSSEQLHWIIGGQLTALAFVLLLYETRVWRWGALRYALAFTLLLFSAEGSLHPLLSGALSPARFDAATEQHLMLAGVCFVVGVVELLRAAGRLRRDVWKAALPVGLSVTAVTFVFHAQHESHVPPILLTVQHRILGASLAVGAAAKTVSELRHPMAKPFAVAWLVPVLLAGVELLLYTEG
jgi:hypothetical protein